jgi:hypothetical protein
VNAEDLAKRLFEEARHWPAGMMVWYRADGRRGIIVEYAVAGDGAVRLMVAFGVGMNLDRCLAYELSAVKVGDGTDGDEWKDVEGTKR